MASSSGKRFVLGASGEDRGADAIGRSRDSVYADADRVVNRVQNRGSGGNHGLFADPFRAEWADRRGIFDQDGLDRRHVSGRRNQVVMEILAFAGEEFFHESMA